MYSYTLLVVIMKVVRIQFYQHSIIVFLTSNLFPAFLVSASIISSHQAGDQQAEVCEASQPHLPHSTSSTSPQQQNHYLD